MPDLSAIKNRKTKDLESFYWEEMVGCGREKAYTGLIDEGIPLDEVRDKKGDTLLHFAAARWDLESCQVLFLANRLQDAKKRGASAAYGHSGVCCPCGAAPFGHAEPDGGPSRLFP